MSFRELAYYKKSFSFNRCIIIICFKSWWLEMTDGSATTDFLWRDSVYQIWKCVSCVNNMRRITSFTRILIKVWILDDSWFRNLAQLSTWFGIVADLSKMTKLCALVAILFIVKASHSQLEECPSCCYHGFNDTSIKSNPRPFWDCSDNEETAINVGKCFSECTYINVSVASVKGCVFWWSI